MFAEHSDFRGLLIGDIDERKIINRKNNMVNKLYQSRVLKDNIKKLQKKRNLSGNLGNLNSYRKEQQKKLLSNNARKFSYNEELDDIDKFTLRIENDSNVKSVGYPKIALNNTGIIMN